MTARRILVVVAVVLLLPLLVLGGLVLFAQSPAGARWLSAQASAKLQREVTIEGIRLDWGWPPGFTFERLAIANPTWAKTPQLLDAHAFYARLEVPPLLEGRVVVPYIGARSATAGLEMDGDRATWHFDNDQKEPSRIALARVYMDDGTIVYLNGGEDTNLQAHATGSLGESGEMRLEVQGKFRGDGVKGTVRLPNLRASLEKPLRLIADAKIGTTSIFADGTLGSDLTTADMAFRLSGETLKHLHKVAGMNLPDTPPYKVSGKLSHAGAQWKFSSFDGQVGKSDLHGNVVYEKSGKRPEFIADLRSRLLDIGDLGPIIGAPPRTSAGAPASAEQKRKVAEIEVSNKVLPHDKFSTGNWDEMDADVKLKADRVERPQALPLDSFATHLVLKDSVMHLQPLDFGVADGRITSTVLLDGRQKPMHADMSVEVQGMHLARLFPTVKTMGDSLGTLYGRGKLTARGESIADLLGTSNGKVSLAVDSGQVSELLSVLLEIDVAKALMLLGTKKQTELRCAVGNFDVKEGVATPDSFVIDTTATLVNVAGSIDFANERFDIRTSAKGKSPSIFVLKTPILLDGPLKQPRVHPKPGPLVAQAGAAVALGAVNPALAIAPFVAGGKAEDADCTTLLAEARGQGAVKKQG